MSTHRELKHLEDQRDQRDQQELARELAHCRHPDLLSCFRQSRYCLDLEADVRTCDRTILVDRDRATAKVTLTARYQAIRTLESQELAMSILNSVVL